MRGLFLTLGLLFVCSSVSPRLWRLQNSGVQGGLRDVCFVDGLHGWIAAGGDGRRGLILHTADGGGTWSTGYVEPSPDHTNAVVHCVAFWDTVEGWAGGCENWTDHNYRTNTRAVLLHSSDGGRTWLRCKYPRSSGDSGAKWETTHYRLKNICLTSSDHGVAMTNGATHCTAGNGSSISIGELHGTGGFGMGAWLDCLSGRGISFVDSLHGSFLMVDHMQYCHRLFSTEKGVDSLSPVHVFPYCYPGLYDVKFIDAKHGWIVGDDGLIFCSRDGGNTWSTQVSGVTNGLFSVTFTDSGNGWIAGENGVILRTRDGGSTWSTENTPTNVCLRKVCFVDTSHGWAVGDSGVVLTYGGPGVEEGSNDQLAMGNRQLSILPNPFVHSTIIEYHVRAKTNISLEIYDITGRTVRTLVSEAKEPGIHRVRWDVGGAHSQDGCATGVYFVRLAVGDHHRETKKLTVF